MNGSCITHLIFIINNMSCVAQSNITVRYKFVICSTAGAIAPPVNMLDEALTGYNPGWAQSDLCCRRALKLKISLKPQ